MISGDNFTSKNMEESNIRLTGLSANTSNLDCNDGDLDISLNLISENGSMRAVTFPEPFLTLNTDENLLFVHNTSSRKIFICSKSDHLIGFELSDASEREEVPIDYTLQGEERWEKITSIGNTLIILTDKRMSYILLKDDGYQYLGEKPPFLSISFGLRGNVARSDLFSIELPDKIAVIDVLNNLTDNNKRAITDTVMARAIEFINNKSRSNSSFIFPFFVRYAYRLYDGNYTMHSAPILMIPSSDMAPMAAITYEASTDTVIVHPGTDREEEMETLAIHTIKGRVLSITGGLDRFISEPSSSLASWNDIIKSIDIFISAPIYTFDQSGSIDNIKSLNNTQLPYSFWGIVKRPTDNKYGKLNFKEAYQNAYSDTPDIFENDLILELPRKDKAIDDISSISLLYKIDSINIDNITYGEREAIIVGDWENLETRERLDDTYIGNHSLLPSFIYPYNSRLNIAGVKATLFDGYPLDSMVCYSNTAANSFSVYTHIKKEGKEIVVKSQTNIPLDGHIYYLYYPDTDAYRMVIERGSAIDTEEVFLSPHSLLNGAYYARPFNDLSFGFYNNSIETEDKSIIQPNKLYTSEVNNPFYFPLKGINTVGVGKILGITSTTRPISTGQFGQFPLLVFSTDGIWAMEVSSDGTYSTKQPMSRDVCSNPGSITQLDGAVAFTSEKGIMIVSGGDTTLISSILDGPSLDIASIKSLSEIATKELLSGEINQMTPFKDYIKDAFMAYDYPNGRIMVINPDKVYAYVYSINQGTWGTISSAYKYAVPDYPSTFLQATNSKIIDLSSKVDNDSNDNKKGIILTRPIKLGDDMLKTVNNIVCRGVFNKTDISFVLYASTDGIFYFPVGSVIGPYLSRICGTPFKYFRILVTANLTRKKSISVISVYYTPKWRNKPR